jgi:glycosyltransferase involved in cell wall biosynthesis
MKRGLVFSKYDTLAASTRQRFVQAIPYLNAQGIEIEIHPLFDNAYLETLFTKGGRNRAAILRGYAKRFLKLLQYGDYDFMWVHCELFPYLPGIFERMVSLSGKPVIFDYDDAIFHQYDAHQNLLVRSILGTKLAPLLRRADVAFCGNAYLQDYAKRYCSRTEIIPTTVDADAYTPCAEMTRTALPTLGWIGSPSTWKYGAALSAMLTSFVAAQKLSVLIIGANHAADHALPFEFRTWSEAREIDDIRDMDIGIMPIPDAPWARGKCGYKLIQYMACGIPVIASPVGVNSEIVQHGVNGFLAATDAEWKAAIEQLVGDSFLRKRMGEAGRKTVEERYSIQRYGPHMAALIHDLF